jgi:hypothetical protein
MSRRLRASENGALEAEASKVVAVEDLGMSRAISRIMTRSRAKATAATLATASGRYVLLPLCMETFHMI